MAEKLSHPYQRTVDGEIHFGEGNYLSAIEALNAAIDIINDQQKALDYLDTHNLLLNERIAKLEAKYENHYHELDISNNITEEPTQFAEPNHK